MKWTLMNTFKRKKEERRIYVTDQRTPEQEAMWQEQKRLKALEGK